MKGKALKASVIVAALLAAAYWYWSPFVAIHSMHQAAERKDADTFNEYVDYSRLRESLKGQFTAILAESMKESSRGGEGIAGAATALGTVLGMAMVGSLIDAMVRPEMIMRAMEEAKLDAARSDAPAYGEGGARQRPEWSNERKGVDKLIAYGRPQGRPDDERFGFVFERTGFSSWKLTEIRFPPTKR